MAIRNGPLWDKVLKIAVCLGLFLAFWGVQWVPISIRNCSGSAWLATWTALSIIFHPLASMRPSSVSS